MRNAPATFQRLMNTVLAGVPKCNAYLNDLVVYSSNWSEHIALLQTVFWKACKGIIDIVDFPKTRRELRRFLGMAGYYLSFCRNFSSVVYPLTNLLSPSISYVWTEECQHAFDSVKALLCNKPVLAAPDVSRAFKLEIDVRAIGAGAVLLQEDASGIDYPICYFSRKFNKHQLNYSTIEKKALALLLSLQYFWGLHWLY